MAHKHEISDTLLDPPHDGHRIAAKDVHLNALFEQDYPRFTIICVHLSKRLVDGACTIVEVASTSLFGNSRQHQIHEVILIRPLLAPCDYIQGNGDSMFYFDDSLIEVEEVGLQAPGELDYCLPFEACIFSSLDDPFSFQKLD